MLKTHTSSTQKHRASEYYKSALFFDPLLQAAQKLEKRNAFLCALLLVRHGKVPLETC